MCKVPDLTFFVHVCLCACVLKLHGLDTNITNFFSSSCVLVVIIIVAKFYETAFGTYEVATREKKNEGKNCSTNYYGANKMNKVNKYRINEKITVFILCIVFVSRQKMFTTQNEFFFW